MVARMFVGFAEIADVVAQVDEQPDREERGEADAENAEKLAGDVAVQRAAERSRPGGQRGQETQRGENQRPGLVGADIGIRETDELLGDGAVFRRQQQRAKPGTQRRRARG